MENARKITTGIVVGRFQTARLTPGHVHLVNTALLQNDEVILFIGCSPLKNSVKQPLDYTWRNAMFLSDERLFRAGRKLIILPIYDKGDDEVWSAQLHKAIDETRAPGSLVRLYGSRDSSFLTQFKADYERVELIPFAEFSATELRSMIARQYPSGREGDDKVREGLIMASQTRYPAVVSAVDNAIFDKIKGKLGVWLGRKPAQKKFRFIGGFAEPTSQNDEEDAIREAKEETCLLVAWPHYIGNVLVDDWRFRGEKDKIRTRFFVTVVVGGTPKAADDIAELKFVPLEHLALEELVKEHVGLRAMLADWMLSARGAEALKVIEDILTKK